MKKLFVLSVLTVLTTCISVVVKAQSNSESISGTWVLDKVKTDIKDLPKELKDYKMVIAYSEKKIFIKNFIEGIINPRFDNNSSNTQAARSGDGIWGDSRANTGLAIKPDYSGSMALSKYFSPNEVNLSLDGKESEIEIIQAGSKVGSAKIKAKEEKQGKSIKSITIRKMKTSKSEEMLVYVRERWDLSEDGKSLKYIKTVEMPNATDEIILVFLRSKTL